MTIADMTIADKVRRGKDDLDRAHAAGIEEGKALGGYNEGFEAGRQKGKQEEYDAFWDLYQNNGTRIEYDNAFAGAGWNNDTFKPKHSIQVLSGYMMFRNSKIEGHLGEILEAMGLSFDTSIMNSSNYMFAGSKFTGVPAIQMSSGAANVFDTESLVTIDKIIVRPGVTFSATAFRAKNLMNLTIEGEIKNDIVFGTCTSLSRPSIESIVTHLSDNASGKTLILSKTAVDEAFAFAVALPDGTIEKVLGTDENNPHWWPLRAKKPNWEIEYAS